MKRIFLVILALLLLGAAELFRSNAIVGVTHYQLALSELPEAFSGFRIVQLSDLHNREFSGLEEKIARERPDLVVMTGDMVSASDRDFSAFLTLARRVAAQFPTYYIVGNHEQALPRAALAELTARLADAGVVILDNRAVQITRAVVQPALLSRQKRRAHRGLYFRRARDGENSGVCAARRMQPAADAQPGIF